MRTYFTKTKERKKAIDECPFMPAKIAKVYEGYILFESENDYKTWKNQKIKNYVQQNI